MKIFDTHAHYSDSKYDEDREKLFKKMYIEGVERICLIGPNLLESIAEKNIFLKYNGIDGMPRFSYTVGDHPDEIINKKPDSIEGAKHLTALEEVCRDKDGKISAVAIGEIGLDYYGDEKSEDIFCHQKEWFIAEIGLAKKLKLPLVIHSRDACEDTMDIMKGYAKGLGGIIHCFSYEKETAIEYVKMGFHIGVGGILTFKNGRKLKEVVEEIPLESIVTETDCPWLSPVPHRGERNESSYIRYVIEEIAKIKKMDLEKVAEVLYKNCKDVYHLL